MYRREMINRVAVGGVWAALTAAGDPAAAQSAEQRSEHALEDMVKAVQSVREELAHSASFWEIAPVRDQLRTFLRANGKFPDYIEVGTDVWQQVYDWHVRFRQPIAVSRTGDGRYAISLMTTLVVMRTDLSGGYIGMPYDNR